MKLKEYIEMLKILAEENPAALEYELVTSKDDEGNGYNAVLYGPRRAASPSRALYRAFPRRQLQSRTPFLMWQQKKKRNRQLFSRNNKVERCQPTDHE